MAIQIPSWARSVVPIALGVAIVAWGFLPAELAVEEEEDPSDGLVGAAVLLLSPYLFFALAGRRARLGAWIALLGFLFLGTALGLWAAGSSSTGALVFLWLLPLQIVAAISAIYFTPGAFRGLPEPPTDPAPGTTETGRRADK